MDHGAPAILHSIEASALAAAIRQSSWAYPLANVGHVLAVIVFAGAVAVMDTRLLGAFGTSSPGDIVRGARRVAVAAFVVIALTGAVLFAAEASHVALNRVFQIKVALIVLALVNVVVFERAFRRQLASWQPGQAMPNAVRLSAGASLALWFIVAACGRSIAYV